MYVDIVRIYLRPLLLVRWFYQDKELRAVVFKDPRISSQRPMALQIVLSIIKLPSHAYVLGSLPSESTDFGVIAKLFSRDNPHASCCWRMEATNFSTNSSVDCYYPRRWRRYWHLYWKSNICQHCSEWVAKFFIILYPLFAKLLHFFPDIANRCNGRSNYHWLYYWCFFYNRTWACYHWNKELLQLSVVFNRPESNR